MPTTVTQTNSVGGATPPGGGAIEVVLPFTSSSTQELIGMQFSPGVTITPGSTISLLYQVVSSTTLSGQYTQVYTQGSVDGGNYFDYTALTTETAPSNSWVTVSTTFPGATGEGVTQFVFQLPANGAPYITTPVTVYIASVSITAPAPSTPTFTPTPIAADSFEFDGGSIEGWAISDGGGSGGTSSFSSPLSIYSPGYNSSAGCLGAYVTFGAANEATNFSYTYSTAFNATSLNIQGIRSEVEITTALSNNPTGAQFYVQSGASDTWANGSWTNLTVGSWVQVFIPESDITDVGEIDNIGVQVGSGGSGSVFAPGLVYVDSVEYY